MSWWSVNHALVVKAAGMTGQAPAGVRMLGVDETRARSVRRLLAESGWRRCDPWMTSFVDLDPTLADHPDLAARVAARLDEEQAAYLERG